VTGVQTCALPIFLLLAPCIPKHWPRFEIVFQYASTRYEIAVENPHGVSRGITRAEFETLAHSMLDAETALRR